MVLKESKKIIILILISVAVYSNTIFNSFIWDEIDIIREDVYMKSVKYIPHLFTLKYWQNDFTVVAPDTNIYRPLWALSFLADYKLWGENPVGWHITNIILFSLCVVILYYFLLSIPIGEMAAFLSSLIFAVYPIHVESVSYVKNRSDILCCIFYLLSIIFFIKTVKSRQNNLQIFKSLNFPISILCFILALFSKEVAITLPVVMFVYLLFKKSIKDNYKLLTIYVIICILFVIYILMNQVTVNNEDSIWLILLTGLTALGEYIKISLLPFFLCTERDLNFSIFTFLYLGIFISLAYYFYKKQQTNGLFFIFLYIITLIPVLNISSVEARPIAEQRLFIPSIGICSIFGIYFYRFWYNKYVKIVFYLFIIILSILVFKRNLVWKDSITLWRTTLKQGCETERVYSNLAVAFEENNMLNEAMAAYGLAIKKTSNPGTIAKIYTNIAILYKKNGQTKEAVEYLKKAIEMDPLYYYASKVLGQIYEEQGLNDEAVIEFEKVIKINKNDFETFNLLGIIFSKTGDLEKAEKNFKKSLEILPNFKEGLVNFGMLNYKLKKYNESIKYIKKAISIDQNYLDASNKLAIIYDTIGNKEDAVKLFRKLIYDNPNYLPARYNLAEIYLKDKMYLEALSEFSAIIEFNSESEVAKKKISEIKRILEK